MQHLLIISSPFLPVSIDWSSGDIFLIEKASLCLHQKEGGGGKEREMREREAAWMPSLFFLAKEKKGKDEESD